MDVKDFQTRQSWGEAQQLLIAAGVILRIAYGEMASVNALVSKQVFTDKQAKSLESTFQKMMSFMGTAAMAYRIKCNEYDKEKASDNKKSESKG